MSMHTVLLIGAHTFSGFECWYSLPEVDVSHTAQWQSVSEAEREAVDVVLVEYEWFVHLSTKESIAFFSGFHNQPIIVLFDKKESIDRESLIAVGVQAVWSVEELQHIDLEAFVERAIERHQRLQDLESEGRQVSALINTMKAVDVRANEYVSGVTKILDAEWVEQSALMLKKVREKNNFLQQIAHHDGLTGLMTRELFHEIMNTTLARVQRHEKHIALLYLDIDHFKQVNDTFGHPVGDQLIQQVAQRLQDTLRDEDLISRLGGDEFAILLMEVNNASAAGLVARKLLMKLNQAPFFIDDFKIPVSVSIGVACYPFAGDTVEELCKHADMALYRSKRGGRNRYQFYTKKINRQMVRRMTLERELDGAIDYNEMSLLFQPVFSMSPMQCQRMRVRLDWNNRKYGHVSVKEFLPIAQQSHMALDLGYWLLAHLIKQIAQWQREDNISSTLQFCVPLSFLQLSDRQFISVFQSLLASHEVDAARIIFEIDQPQWMQAQVMDYQLLKPLVELGSEVTLTQFGMAPIDIDRLLKMPIARVVVDSSCINGGAGVDESKGNLLINIAQTMRLQIEVTLMESAKVLENLAQTQGLDFSLQEVKVSLNCDQVIDYINNSQDMTQLISLLSD